MTPAAAVLPDAAVRMMRAVAGRRGLQVALLLAGLLALGFLCGERAHAVDSVPTPTPTAPERAQSARASEPVRERVAEPARERVLEPVRKAVGEPVADAAEPVGRTARDVVRPVVDGVTGVLESAPQRVLPEGRASDIPEMPGVPGVPGVPETPDLPRPDPGTEPQPPQGGDKPGDGRSDADARAHEVRKSSAARGDSSYGTGDRVGTGITYLAGQQARAASLLDRDTDTSDSAHGAGHEPFPPAPGDPGRTLAGQSVGDGSSTRHGDPGAASSDSRAPVRLLQGAGAGQVPAPIRERHRDIPEFPG